MLTFSLAISQYSSCPLILFSATPNDSQEACAFVMTMIRSYFSLLSTFTHHALF